MESELAYGFKKSWSPPASPSRDHHMGSASPESPVSPQSSQSPRTHRLKTVIRSSTPSPRRSPKISASRVPYNRTTEDEARIDPSREAEKTASLSNIGVNHATRIPSSQEVASPEWNDNVRWEDCVAFGSEIELSPREHPIEWLTHTLKDKKKMNPLHWPTLKERTSFTREERASPGVSDSP